MKFDPKTLRKTVLEMAYAGSTVHIGCAFSIIELLSILYKNHLRYPQNNPLDKNRDYFILSKGHGAPGLFQVLAERGYFSLDKLKEFTPKQGSVIFFKSTPNSYHGVNRFKEINCPKRFFIYGSYALNKPVIWKFNDIPYYPHIIKTKKKMLTSFHDANYLTVPVTN